MRCTRCNHNRVYNTDLCAPCTTRSAAPRPARTRTAAVICPLCHKNRVYLGNTCAACKVICELKVLPGERLNRVADIQDAELWLDEMANNSEDIANPGWL